MLAYLFILVALLFRALNVSGLPVHFLNFTPVAAALLFFGARQPRRQALLLPGHALETLVVAGDDGGVLLVGGDEQLGQRGVHVEQRGFEWRRVIVDSGSVHRFPIWTYTWSSIFRASTDDAT